MQNGNISDSKCCEDCQLSRLSIVQTVNVFNYNIFCHEKYQTDYFHRYFLKSWDLKASKGEDVMLHEFPFQAAIVNAYDRTFMCAGAIIDQVNYRLQNT